MNGQVVDQVADVFISGFNSQVTLCSNHTIAGRICRSETARECRNAVVGKPQHGGSHFVDFAESWVHSVSTGREDLVRFIMEQVAGGIDAIDANVVQGATARSLLQPDSPFLRLHRERRNEDSFVPECAGANRFHSFQIRFFKVKSIGDHEPDLTCLSSVEHREAFCFGGRHRLLAQNMNAGFGSLNGKLAVQMVGSAK